jgi:hypothetical protein
MLFLPRPLATPKARFQAEVRSSMAGSDAKPAMSPYLCRDSPLFPSARPTGSSTSSMTRLPTTNRAISEGSSGPVIWGGAAVNHNAG